jgi:hypothetical protein
MISAAQERSRSEQLNTQAEHISQYALSQQRIYSRLSLSPFIACAASPPSPRCTKSQKNFSSVPPAQDAIRAIAARGTGRARMSLEHRQSAHLFHVVRSRFLVVVWFLAPARGAVKRDSCKSIPVSYSAPSTPRAAADGATRKRGRSARDHKRSDEGPKRGRTRCLSILRTQKFPLKLCHCEPSGDLHTEAECSRARWTVKDPIDRRQQRHTPIVLQHLLTVSLLCALRAPVCQKFRSLTVDICRTQQRTHSIEAP